MVNNISHTKMRYDEVLKSIYSTAQYLFINTMLVKTPVYKNNLPIYRKYSMDDA